MPTTPATTPTPATPTVGAVTLFKHWAMWQTLAAGAFGLALNKLPMPVWLQPWLNILWLLPVLVLIYEAWPRFAKTAAVALGSIWFISSLLISIPLAQTDFDEYLLSRDQRAADSWSRATVDFWLKFSGTVNPGMLSARVALFDDVQQAMDEYGDQLKADLQAQRATVKTDPEGYVSKVLEIQAKIDLWQDAYAKVVKTVKGKKTTPFGPFGVPFVFWTMFTLGATVCAVKLAENSFGRMALIVFGGLLTMAYFGSALEELRDGSAIFQIPLGPGGTMPLWFFALIIAGVGMLWAQARKYLLVIAMLVFVWWLYAKPSDNSLADNNSRSSNGRTFRNLGPVSLPSDTEGLVRQAASRWNVPFDLVAAVCVHESGCRFSIQDGASGEIGQMQIMPGTGQHYGVSVTQLRDPAVNIDTGARILSDHLRNFANAPDPLFKALLAYNSTVLAEKYRNTPWNEVPREALRGRNPYGVQYDAGRYVEEVVAMMANPGRNSGSPFTAWASTRPPAPKVTILPAGFKSEADSDPKPAKLTVINQHGSPVHVVYVDEQGEEKPVSGPNGMSNYGGPWVEETKVGSAWAFRDPSTNEVLATQRVTGNVTVTVR